MPVIENCKSLSVKRPPSSSIRTSYGKADAFKEHIVVSISDKEGHVGYGEATPLPHFTGETASSIRLILEEVLLPLLPGLDSDDISLIHDVMDHKIYGNTAAKAAVDMALYDLSAKNLHVPLYKLLGGMFRHAVPINRHIGICPVDEAVSLASGFVAEGYLNLKMKIGSDADDDIRRVKSVREAVGESVNIRVDANQGYDLRSAHKVLHALEDQNLEYCEQPLPAWDMAGLKALKGSTSIPIGVDESLHSVRDALKIATLHCADIFVIKLIKTGGIYPALQLANIAASAGITCVVTSPFDTQIGAAHALHLAASLPNATIAADLTCYASQGDLGKTCHSIRDGKLFVGPGYGCGVESILELE